MAKEALDQAGDINSSSPHSDVLADPQQYTTGVPYHEFARLRRLSSVAWVNENARQLHSSSHRTVTHGSGYWAVVGYSSVVAVSRQPEVYSSAYRGAFLTDPQSRQDLERTRQLLLNMDAPEHTPIRKLAMRAFTPQALQQLHQSIRTHAANIVGRVLHEEQFDVVRDVAAELPLLVLADMLGMPREDRSLIYQWSNTVVGFDDPDFGGGSVEAYNRTFAEGFEYARKMAASRRAQPTDDLVSFLVTGEIDGRHLTDSEFCHLWMLLVIGGNESTRHLLSGSLQALTEWPEQRNRLAAGEAPVPAAVEEFLRWVSPIMQFRRTAVQDTELNGQPIKAGDKIMLYYVSANRDEEVFPHADQLDLQRTPNPHVAFGIGPHFCLGAHLARLEAVTLFEMLRPHLPRFELTGPVVRLKSNFMNGIKSMPARFAH
jgi:cytochrome P450